MIKVVYENGEYWNDICLKSIKQTTRFNYELNHHK